MLGELRNPRVAALPLAAAFGGMLVPAGVVSACGWQRAGRKRLGHPSCPPTRPSSSDAWRFSARAFQENLRLFLLSLAIFDDVGAILVVAIGYGDTLNWAALGAAGIGFAVVAAISRLGVRNIPVYFAIGGGIWLAFDASGSMRPLPA